MLSYENLERDGFWQSFFKIAALGVKAQLLAPVLAPIVPTRALRVASAAGFILWGGTFTVVKMLQGHRFIIARYTPHAVLVGQVALTTLELFTNPQKAVAALGSCVAISYALTASDVFG